MKSGKIKLEDIPLARRYGNRSNVTMPGEGKIEKIETAMKAILEDENKKEGDDKKDNSSKKEESPKTENKT
ncbi:MAG: hypothetical protein AABX72_01460 [Nanoarchaeota archaeon]